MRIRPVDAAALLLLGPLFACSQPPSLHGRVVVTGSTTFDGVSLRLTGPESRSATTGADGTYTFTALPPGDYVLTFAAASTVEGTLVAEATLASSDVTLDDRRFTGTGAAQGLATRGGLPGRDLTLLVDGTSLTTVTGDDGRWRIEGIPAGSHTVTASATGYEDTTSAAFDVTWRATAEVPELTLTAPGFPFTGHARTYDSTDARDLQVTLDDGAPVTTDEDGAFTFPTVTVGRHTLTVERDDCRATYSGLVMSAAGGAMLEDEGVPYPLQDLVVPCARQLGDWRAIEARTNATGTHAIVTEEERVGEHRIRRTLHALATGEEHEIPGLRSSFFSPDGSRLAWITSSGTPPEATLWSTPVAEFSPVQHATATADASPAFTPDGAKALVFDQVEEGGQAARARILDFATGTFTTLTDRCFYNGGPLVAFSADSSKVAWFSAFDRNADETATLHVTTLADGATHDVDTGINLAYPPLFSRDGTQLAYAWTPRTGAAEVRVAPSLGGPPVTLLSDPDNDRTYLNPELGTNAAFSSTGDRLVVTFRQLPYSASGPLRQFVRSYPTAGGDPVEFTHPNRAGFLDMVSRDGRYVVSIEGGIGTDIGLYPRVFTFDGAAIDLPHTRRPDVPHFRPSPDGSAFAYTAVDDSQGGPGIQTVVVVRVDGTGLHAHEGHTYNRPEWTPSGAHLVYTHRSDDGTVALRAISRDGGNPFELDAAIDGSALNLFPFEGGTLYAKRLGGSTRPSLSSVRFGNGARAHFDSTEVQLLAASPDGTFLAYRPDVPVPFRSQIGLYSGHPWPRVD